MTPDNFHERILGAVRRRDIASASAGTIQFSKDDEVLLCSGTGAVTLGAPRCVGHRVQAVQVAAGTTTITCTSAMNAAGNTTCALDAILDSVFLIGVDVGGTLKWCLVANQGGLLA
jgi:hypothetical protein